MLGIKLRKIHGQSMFPTYQHNDYVVHAHWPGMALREGMIVVVNHPIYQYIIKRIRQIDELGNMLLAGDNPQSVSQNNIGWVDKTCLLGKVIFHIPQKPITLSSKL